MLKMNHLTLIVLVFTLQAVISAQLFEIQYDGIKLDDILKDEPLMEKYGDCILDVGPCTEDGKKIKQNIPDALKSDCSKCGTEQSYAMRRILDFLIENRKAWFDEIAEKYDPEGIYFKAYQARKKNQ
ncbi:ejaculatory bulb-specific protein 3 [Aethina tumida]|uniref:ejaculatory bulb-specific protein 3 n=1 Tax=Aethina tumida TaxID=116153 RepID=UPI00096B2687|nr:ejaculatory bulb-specific protein 3 [Aethina tumida]